MEGIPPPERGKGAKRMYRILIVEDDRGIAGAVQTQLEACGLEAKCVSDFRNVLGEFAQYQPHLVLMDI